jgi:uncharacterized protein (DUF697 family)
VSVNRKKLPKAISRTIDDMREATDRSGAREQQEAPARASDANKPAPDGATAPQPDRVSDVVAAVPAPPAASPPVTGVVARAAPTRAGIDATGRRSLARAIVERHAVYSAVGGIIPLPIVNVASITAVIVRMVKVLSDCYGVPFQRDRARAIVVGLMGGAMPTGLAAVTTSTLVYIVPGSNLIGLAVSSLAGAACTRAIGRIFVEHFESGATLTDFPTIESR